MLKRRGTTGTVALAGLAVAMLGLAGPTVARTAVAKVQSAFRPPAPAEQAQVAASFGKLPLRFEPNLGQVDPAARFVARAAGGTIFLTQNDAVLTFGAPNGTPATAAAVRMRALDANPATQPEGVDLLPGVTNYLTGNDPAAWQTGIRSYAEVRYPSVYPGIDQVFHGKQNALEYDFIVAPGADPTAITLGFDGVNALTLDRSGDLVLGTPAGQLRHKAPTLYQEGPGGRSSVSGRYVVSPGHRVGFDIGEYDRSLPLVIDPLIAYSAFLGGTGNDVGRDIAVDAAGAAYITGSTESAAFPATAGAFDTVCGTGLDAIGAVDASCGRNQVFFNGVTTAGSNSLTLVPGTGTVFQAADIGRTIVSANLPNGTTIIARQSASQVTLSTNATVTGSNVRFTILDRLASKSDAFVAKLNPAGTALEYSTYLGGMNADVGSGVTLDRGAAWLTGTTNSGDFPTTVNALDRVCGTGIDALGGADTSCDGNSTFTSGTTTAGSNVLTFPSNAIATADVGRPIISPNFPAGTIIHTRNNSTTATLSANATATGTDVPFTIPNKNPKNDAWAVKLAADGSSLLYSTFLGGAGEDSGARIIRDDRGAVSLVGTTVSPDFPVSVQAPGITRAFDAKCGGGLDLAGAEDGSCDANVNFFDGVTTLDSNVLTSATATFTTTDVGRALISPNLPAGTKVLAHTSATEVTLTANATATGTDVGFTIAKRNGPRTDAFLTRLNTSTGALSYSTYFGGNQNDTGTGVAFDFSPQVNFPQAVYITGTSGGGTFPTTPGAFQTTCGAGIPGPACVNTDAFVARFRPGAGGDNLLNSTLLGGRQDESAAAIAVDLGGNTYITGSTTSPGFPTKDAFQNTLTRTPDPFSTSSGGTDAFLTKLTVEGSALNYSTFLGGTGTDRGMSVKVDSLNNASVYGTTDSTDFFRINSIQAPNGKPGVDDLFVTTFSPSGRDVSSSTTLGSLGQNDTRNDSAGAIALGAAGSTYVTGATSEFNGGDFSSLPGSLRAGPQGAQDAFVLKLVPGRPPLISASTPGGGVDVGGTSVVIRGENLGGVTAVQFGGAAAAGFTVVSDTEIRAVSPPRPAGIPIGQSVFITVTNPTATSIAAGAGRFLYGEGTEFTGPCAGACPTPTSGSNVMATLTDGRVLATAGSTSQLFDPKTGTWAATGSCAGCATGGATLTRLLDGRVLHAGGEPSNGSFLYDPATGSWAPTTTPGGTVTTMTASRFRHSASLLVDGRVLVVSDGTAETFDPVGGTWTRTTGDPVASRRGHSSTLLDPAVGGCGSSCGKVLVAFGYVGFEGMTTAELFDPVTGTFSATGDSVVGRVFHPGVQLADGRVLVAAGSRSQSIFEGGLNSAEIYNPVDGSWSPTGILPRGVVTPLAVRFRGGKVLLTGGLSESAVAAVWDPADGRWRETATLPNTALVLLPPGPVSACGQRCGAALAYGPAQSGVYYPGPVVGGLAPATGRVGATVTVTGTGLASATSVSFGGVPAPSFTSDPANPDGQLTAVVPPGVTGAVDVRVNTLGGVSPVVPAGRFTVQATFSTFVAVSPARILDTRSGNGAPVARVGAGQSVNLQVTGRGGVPGSGVTAVALNVTAVAPTASTFVTAWPTGESRPNASNLNLGAGAIVPNLVSVKVGAGGQVSLYNDGGAVDLLADVAGYYLDPAAVAPGSSFVAVSPARVLDTRSGTGAPAARVGAGQSIDVQITGQGGVPASGVTAVAVNVTAVAPTAESFVTGWPAGETRPVASSLNLAPGVTRPNMVIVKVGAGGRISLHNDSGTVDLLADVAGYFLGPAAAVPGSTFVPLSPARILDTRTGTGAPAARIVAAQSIDVQVTGQGGVPSTGVTSVVVNVTAAAPSAASFVTAWPSGESRPGTSSLNLGAGVTVANLVVVKVGAAGKVSLYNDTGTVDLIGDVAGYYAA